MHCRYLGEFSPPGSTLSFVASNLPPWKNPTDFARLSEDDFGAVILEYVNAYECVLRERGYSLAIDVTREEFQWSDIIFGAGLTPIILEKITKETADQQEKIDRELLTARAIANRVLEFVGGFNRLLTLDKELQCMQRASLDFRNAFAIAAETSSCLPRIWNAKDSLRDICDDPLRCDPQP